MIYFSYFYLCVLCEFQMCAGTHGSQETSKPLNQQLQVVVSHWMWVLGPYCATLEEQPSVLSHLITKTFLQPLKTIF